MKRLLSALAALFVVVAVTLSPAQADVLTKAVNTASNTAFGWLDCPKAIADETAKAASRLYVGVLVTAPVMCGTNVAVRYTGVAMDWATLLFSWVPGLDKNVVTPAVHESTAPPIKLPK